MTPNLDENLQQTGINQDYQKYFKNTLFGVKRFNTRRFSVITLVFTDVRQEMEINPANQATYQFSTSLCSCNVLLSQYEKSQTLRSDFSVYKLQYFVIEKCLFRKKKLKESRIGLSLRVTRVWDNQV